MNFELLVDICLLEGEFLIGRKEFFDDIVLVKFWFV